MKRTWLGIAGVVTSLAACSDDGPEGFAGPVVYDDFPESAAGSDRSEDLGFAHAIVLSAGFANGQAVQYLALGEFNPVPAKVYIPTRGGAPVPGQFPIVDTLPDDDEYSPYWQVVEVAVPGSYKANDVKSLKGLEDAGYEMTETMEALHCPIVNPDATWIAADLSTTFLVFWGTGEEIPNPYFDPSADVTDTNKPTLVDADATEGDIVLQPLWQKRMRAFCWSDDLARRFPLVDEDGTPTLDLSNAALLLDSGPDNLPVFDQNVGDAGYHPAVFIGAVSPLDGAQPGSTSDFDPAEVEAAIAEPVGLVDSPIVFPLALDRFRVTVTNTTTAGGEGAVELVDGISLVEDGQAPLFVEGEPAPAELDAYLATGDPSILLGSYPLTGRPLSPILDSQPLPALAPGESAEIVVLAGPFVGLLTTVQAIGGVEGAFVGISEAPLYDESFAAIASQTLDLMAYITTDEGVNPEPPPETIPVVGPHPDITAPVGTVTVELITGGTP